jgi:hypothetical protein
MPKITQLPELTAPNPDDWLAAVSGGVTKKLRLRNIGKTGGAGSGWLDYATNLSAGDTVLKITFPGSGGTIWQASVPPTGSPAFAATATSSANPAGGTQNRHYFQGENANSNVPNNSERVVWGLETNWQPSADQRWKEWYFQIEKTGPSGAATHFVRPYGWTWQETLPGVNNHRLRHDFAVSEFYINGWYNGANVGAEPLVSLSHQDKNWNIHLGGLSLDPYNTNPDLDTGIYMHQFLVMRYRRGLDLLELGPRRNGLQQVLSGHITLGGVDGTSSYTNETLHIIPSPLANGGNPTSLARFRARTDAVNYGGSVVKWLTFEAFDGTNVAALRTSGEWAFGSPSGLGASDTNYDVGFTRNAAGVLQATQGQGAGGRGKWDAAAFILNGGPFISSGAGSPEGVVTAPKGSVFLRSDGGAGTSVYIKENGSDASGWAAK